jgi:hypothetical protein
MQKVLVISYFFYPCNLTAASRPRSWQLNMHKKDYYPIVLTRHWTGKELTEQQRLSSSGNELKIEKFEHSEIHYLPYKASLRDKMFIKGTQSSFYAFLSKTLTFIELVMRNITIRSIPYNNIYHHAREILKGDDSIKKLIISGNPFEQFYFGFLLKKEFPQLAWVADYRDEWTTSEINEFGLLKKALNYYDSFFEKKWVKNASLITANTRYATRKLSELHGKRAVTILNGFYFEQLPKMDTDLDNNSLRIVHNGTLYPTQKITLLRNALRRVNIPKDFEIILKFPGILIKKDVSEYLILEFEGVPVKLELSDRVSQQEILKMQIDADLMLMVAHENIKGIVGSKLYEYIGLKKPVLLCPTDEDELEATLKDVGLGIIVKEEDELIKIFEALILEKQTNGKISLAFNEQRIEAYNRENQVKELVQHLNEIDE